jgi:methionyl-tRNA synthetase
VSVPWDPEQVFYVWFDALLNYVTALRFAREGEDLTNRYWPADVQLVGKDILKFHAVYWPALLMAAGLEVQRALIVHGYLLMDGEKMSKSLGNVLDPFEVIERFGADALRFYLLREVQFGADGSVGTAGFEARYSTELANDYGNLASRSIAMATRWRDGQLSPVTVDPAIHGELDGLAAEVSELLDRAELTQALEAIWTRVRRLNRYVEERAPWVLAKDPEQAGELDVVLGTLIEGLRAVTVVLHAFMPESTGRLLAALGEPEVDWAASACRPEVPAMAVQEIEPLFPKP